MRTLTQFVLALTLTLGATNSMATVIYVDDDATGMKDGSSWRDAHTDLSNAIAGAEDGDQIWVAEGTYGSITLKTGVEMYGGFAGIESSASQSDPRVHATIISGGGIGRAIRSVGNTASTILRGFQIVEGRVSGVEAGGGLYLENSNILIVDCVFTRNISDYMGGAVAIYGGGSPRFENCIFYDNGTRDTIARPMGGGAVFNHGGSPTFVNSLFHNNVAGEGGAIATLGKSGVTLINCTLAENQADRGDGGGLFDAIGKSTLQNCILWNNKAPLERASEIFNHLRDGGTTDARYSLIQGGWIGEGNIATDPLFVNPAGRDFRLRENSPCTDRGQRAALPPDVADLDWDGNTTEPTPVDLGHNSHGTGTSVDMGAFRRVSP